MPRVRVVSFYAHTLHIAIVLSLLAAVTQAMMVRQSWSEVLSCGSMPCVVRELRFTMTLRLHFYYFPERAHKFESCAHMHRLESCAYIATLLYFFKNL